LSIYFAPEIGSDRGFGHAKWMIAAQVHDAIARSPMLTTRPPNRGRV
jgi:hypothetical protein